MKTSSTSYGTSELTTQREIHLKDLVQVVKHHWKIAVLFPLLVAGGAYWTSRNTITSYSSVLKVQISSPKQVFARLDDIDVDEFALRTDPILSEALVLQTQALALRVVAATNLQLWLNNPTDRREDIFRSIHINPDSVVEADYELLRGQANWQLRDLFGNMIDAGPYGDTADGPGFSVVVYPTSQEGFVSTNFSIISPETAASFVTGGLNYAVVEQTTAVDISYTGTDPTLVPIILNSAAVQLRDMGVDRAEEAALRRETYISNSLEEFESDQQTALTQLQSFRESEQITNLSAEETAIIDRISAADIEKQELEAFTATLRDAIQSADSVGIESLNRLSAVSGVSDNSALSFQIQNLLRLYDERHTKTAGDLGLSAVNPEVLALDQRIRSGYESLRTAARSALQSAEARVTVLARQISDFRRELATYPGKESAIAQIQQDLEIKNQTVQYLLGQQQQARMQRATIGAYIRLLDGASPAAPLGTSRNQKIFLGFLVGGLLGLGATFFLEYLDQTIKSSSDIERILRLPVLGLIPDDANLSTKNDRRLGLKVLRSLDPEDNRAEAFRSLRTNVTFVGAERTLQYIAVTSPGPGEGKSTTAANLAATLGMGGHKTLLIDGDLRRPLLHHAFSLVQEPGLTDVLIGGAAIKEAVRPDVAQNLDLMPAGPTPPNPSELLGSDSMHSLISELRRDYEYIVFDTPPILPVTDAAVVASSADATIMVLRAGSTEEQAAQRALDQLQRVHSRMAGAVLNGVLQKHDRYYYSYDSYRNEPPTRSRPLRQSIPSRVANMF